MELGRRQIFGTKEREFSASQQNTGGRGKPVEINSHGSRESFFLGFQYLCYTVQHPWRIDARCSLSRGRWPPMAGLSPKPAQPLEATPSPWRETFKMPSGWSEPRLYAACGTANDSPVAGVSGLWPRRLRLRSVRRQPPTRCEPQSHSSGLPRFRAAGPEQSLPIGLPLCTAPRAGC